MTADVIRSEFIGTEARVAKSTNSHCKGLSGKIIDETKNTFIFLTDGKKKIIAKDTGIFHFKFADGTVSEIDGKLLMARSEDRLKKSIRRLW